MMSEFVITLPLPPSVNGLHIAALNGRRRKSPTYKAWLDEAGWRINEARAGGSLKNLPTKNWYWTDIYLPHNHTGDSDNRVKSVHDLLHKMGLTPDDKWLWGGTYCRHRSVQKGTCIVQAKSLLCGGTSPALVEHVDLRGVVS